MLQLAKASAACVFALAAALAGCAAEECDDVVEALPPVVSGYSALSSSDFLSVNGTYGAQCTGRVGQSWSVAIAQGASLDNSALSVVYGNSTCVLTITGLRTASYLYTASPGLTLGSSYQASPTLFSATGSVTFGLNAKLTDATFSSAIAITLQNSADPAVASHSNVSFYTYEATIQNTSGLVSYWRLNESSAFVVDDFSGTDTTVLSSRTGSTGATWTRDATAPFESTAVITNANRVRAQDSGNQWPTVYLASGTPPSADYAVEATIHIKTKVSDPDAAGVLVRASAGTHYFGGYWNQENDDNERWWTIRRCDSTACDTGTSPGLGYVIAPEVGDNQNYTVRLEVSGSTPTTLKLYVNNVLKVTVTQAAGANPITSAGKVGIRLGGDRDLDGSWTNQSNTQGAHIDDIRAEQLANDAKGADHGSYLGPTRGATGALVGDSGTAVTFDGVNDYILANRGIADSFSIEFWFKTAMATTSSTNTHWFTTTNKGLFDANQTSSILDFGVSMRPDGKILAGIGQGTDSSVSILSSSAYNNDAWHHLVFTRRKGTNATTDPSALALYIDGVVAATSITSTNISSLTGATDINVGRLRSGSGYFAGSIDEVATYNVVLTEATALNHYQTGKLRR